MAERPEVTGRRDGLRRRHAGSRTDKARVGDTVACEVQNPHPATLALTLETPAAVAHANTLLANKRSGWRLVGGCHECAWGKVAGCWRCGRR